MIPTGFSNSSTTAFAGSPYISHGQCQLVSRNNHIYKRFDPLAETLAKLKVTDAIVDGEIIGVDAKGNSVFNELFLSTGHTVFLRIRFAVVERSRLATITVD